jgi:endo-1,4-beta-D-glucanase Y
MPQGRNHRDAFKSYLTWKSTFVTADSACGFRRVLFDDMTSTTSEGIGYGMLMAVTFNDRRLFDDLWGYYKHVRNENGLMQWHISSSCAVIGYGAATDADEDVAFALLLADQQWCSNGAIPYRQDAVALINRIWEHEVEHGTYVLKPGDGAWGGSHVLNPSYFAPAYYRAFEEATGNTGWSKVISQCYAILRKCAHPGTGLVPDWCRADGSPAQGREENFYYYWDAARTPWRIALDYLWYGTEQARMFCEKIIRFADSVGVAHLANGYYLDGKPMRTDPTSVFIGAFGVAAMAAGPAYQAFCNAAYRVNVATALPPERNYYNWSLRTLTLMVQTGNFPGVAERP